MINLIKVIIIILLYCSVKWIIQLKEDYIKEKRRIEYNEINDKIENIRENYREKGIRE